MARKEGKVYLGYEDEFITENNLTLVNFTVNKIGGQPVSFLKKILFEAIHIIANL